MYSVTVEKECGCFKRSEYKKEKSFDNQQDAFTYSKAMEELMNEEFCKKHLFIAQKTADDQYMIKVAENPKGGGCCGSGHCG